MDRNGNYAGVDLALGASLSARRAWIEIISPDIRADVYSVALRKESVDRNSSGLPVFLLGHWSLSARRAWIEIIWVSAWVYTRLSLSARRAWIEIPISPLQRSGTARSLSARRAWIEIYHINGEYGPPPVALRKESVDRNPGFAKFAYGRIKSLSARRAWIEIQVLPMIVTSRPVALRKESVDRNGR